MAQPQRPVLPHIGDGPGIHVGFAQNLQQIFLATAARSEAELRLR